MSQPLSKFQMRDAATRLCPVAEGLRVIRAEPYGMSVPLAPALGATLGSAWAKGCAA